MKRMGGFCGFGAPGCQGNPFFRGEEVARFNFPDDLQFFARASSSMEVRLTSLSPIAKLVFYALATKACGTDRTVWMSDGAIARRCGVSRPSVISGMHQLLAVGLVEKVGLPVIQIQAYRICHPLFGKASGHTVTSDLPRSSSPAAMALRSLRELPPTVPALDTRGNLSRMPVVFRLGGESEGDT